MAADTPAMIPVMSAVVQLGGGSAAAGPAKTNEAGAATLNSTPVAPNAAAAARRTDLDDMEPPCCGVCWRSS
ncbi:hypothetical protein MANY_15090 [Mycolicibacterium anyangense]|uniref:Uncharacterized protein n=1 Tax=Mycolicibacterium anyangense TaxID=1431246 RepID=A0A6N4W7Z8_9MYCO|nr:hypothetical protein MANY_15090 [Mycolicibacterium anyangense]